jgi:quinol monooxygenase YgiN
VSASVRVVALLTARPGKIDELRSLLVGMAPHSRAEPGNLRWDLWRDHAVSDRFVVDELYRDQAAAAAHHETPHYKDYFARINGLAERTVAVLEPIEVS